MRAIESIELKQYLDDKSIKTLLIDVREASEVNEKKIKGSTHIPLHSLPSQMALLKDYDQLIISCKSGNRAKQAAAYLENAGLFDVLYLTTHSDDWEKGGIKVVCAKKKPYTLENQIDVIFGLLILLPCLAGFLAKQWLILPIILGFLLTVNGLFKRSLFQFIKEKQNK